MGDAVDAKGLEPGTPGRSFAQTFCLHLRAPRTPSGVGNAKVLGHRRHLRGLSFRLLLEGRLNCWAGSYPRCLFERNLQALRSKGLKERAGHAEPFGCHLLRVGPAKVDRQVVDPGVSRVDCRLVERSSARWPKGDLAQGNSDGATCQHPTTSEGGRCYEAVCRKQTGTSVRTEGSPQKQGWEVHFLRMGDQLTASG